MTSPRFSFYTLREAKVHFIAETELIQLGVAVLRCDTELNRAIRLTPLSK